MQKPHTDADYEGPAYKIVNAEELSLNLLRLYEQGGRVLTEFIERADTRWPLFGRRRDHRGDQHAL